MNKAVFLDRDGTINEEMGYINHISRFKIFDYFFPALKILKDLGYKVIIITNQSGIARGYFSESLVKEIHSSLKLEAQNKGTEIDGIYYCPHHKDGIIEKYSIECTCRKPKPGLILKAKQEHDINFSESFMIGDRYKDMEFAFKNGLKTIMVMTGYGIGEYTYQKNTWPQLPDYICENILQAAETISNLKLR
ncbi:MAG: HAD family hydrolase [Calditrichae bacterium]|nr:HAD family hydrolase [Calditrichota bacterium]MCB9057673.1 HAD family hydrolase [Calditrichia bacterium]